MNKMNPKKLLNSKWTAVTPIKKEKHFMMTEIGFNENRIVISCSIEAVMSKRTIPINWYDLKDDNNGLHCWK
ncbi:MAG: TIGR02450 family Trp-rich protein [Pseudomonadota bacterium]|nr:TIGR02450 family Trp-rich protein [Pseudomonadota bacterium]